MNAMASLAAGDDGAVSRELLAGITSVAEAAGIGLLLGPVPRLMRTGLHGPKSMINNRALRLRVARGVPVLSPASACLP